MKRRYQIDQQRAVQEFRQLLDESRLTGMTPHRRRQRLASVQHVQPRHAEVQP